MQSVHSDLKAWVESAMQKCREAGFPPGPFAGMLDRWAVEEAMKRCILNTDPDSTPLRRLVQAGLGEWSIEQGVINFPDIFGADVLEAARWRLGQVAGKRGAGIA